MKKIVKRIALGIVAVVLIGLVALVCVYFTRFQTIATIEKGTNYPDGYNLYTMDVKYDYNVENIIAEGEGSSDANWATQAVVGEALPYAPIKIETPKFGCSSFGITTKDGKVLMGRNYDFKTDTSAIMVRCEPKDGYKSIAFGALSNIHDNEPDAGIVERLKALTAPFICLDGINEKGVSISVLTLDSDPTQQTTSKHDIFTTLAMRLVLDRAATTQEAVDLLRSYDMHANSGRDHHFYINDASCDGRVVEWDCESDTRELTDTPTRTTTNFFITHKDKVTSDGKNGIYGHGKDRYDKIEKLLDANEGNYTEQTAWDALQEAQQLPKEGEVTSNTQWSVVYNNTDCTADVVIRRNWDDNTTFEV